MPEHTGAEAIRMTTPQPGTDYDWDAPATLYGRGVNGSTLPLPYGLDPAHVPLAGSYVVGPQQPSTLTSAWYQLPAADDGHPLVVVTAAGTITGKACSTAAPKARPWRWNTARPAPKGLRCRGDD
jgi:arabinosyltransferase B